MNEFSGSNCCPPVGFFSLYEKNRPKDIFDTDLSIHLPVIFGIVDEFYETLTLEKAKILFHMISAIGLKSNNIYEFMLRSDHYVKRYNELMDLVNNKEKENDSITTTST